MMHLLIGKLPLLGYQDGELTLRHPAADSFALLAEKMAGARAVSRVTMGDRPGLHAFEVDRAGRGPLLVVWDHRDPFDGEDEPPAEVTWPWPAAAATVTDVFGRTRTARCQDGQIRLPVSVTPLFVEPQGHSSSLRSALLPGRHTCRLGARLGGMRRRAQAGVVYRGWVHRIESGRARVAMVASYRAVTDDVGTLDEDELARPSRCRHWSRADLLFHMLLDAQRALVTFATPAAGEPDVDFISYWTPFRPGAEGYAAHARFVRRVASSYRSELVIAGQWAETAAAAAHVAATLPADVKVATQGHVLFAGDFLATLAVEATVHHLDLVAGDERLSGPSCPGLAVARETLDGALGEPVPVGWDDVDYVLKATGRVELTADDRVGLGVLASRFPLLG